jgi:gliding motility-associated-like protein
LFTPNGDKLNDLFVIRDLDKFPGTYLRIVNRWGKVETEVNDYKNDWSGDDLEEGIYYYNIKRGVDGQNFSGFVELKR